MSVKPTLASVAKEAGVSIPTVSQVMRGTGRISEQTRKKVLQAAKKLHYVTDSRAAAMRSGEYHEVGFLINQLSNPFNAEVISGVVDLLDAEGYLVSVLDTRDDAARQSRHLDAFIRQRRGGLIWVPALQTDDDTLAMLAAQAVPTVSFMRPANAQMDYVGIRNAEATAMATRHLIELGHRHIAYLGGVGMNFVRKQRVEGYVHTLSAQGLGEGIVWQCPENKLAGLSAMQELMHKHPQVTAVVCNGDMVAIGACLALARDGLVAGHDMSVIGFDDIQDAIVATPPLTTMAISPKNLGMRLARVLLDRMRDPKAPATATEVSAKLVLRQTTGVPG
ncbi:LacI family DNA-binding transcriptional regulator [Paracoccus sp. JM45]|uniref:LacI family DNA-binding transcriptional regulator n=1 Tax=Paracoccus sp. JM45 TaxID=2283626 RepID=UPI000E6BA195|nr:LacI family DNA-binding transcriptional regulator [Paracoccus sp. JM45]RJE78922.1 LacI family transcriptional regulator [Paracoccus sp. JM45]